MSVVLQQPHITPAPVVPREVLRQKTTPAAAAASPTTIVIPAAAAASPTTIVIPPAAAATTIDKFTKLWYEDRQWWGLFPSAGGQWHHLTHKSVTHDKHLASVRRRCKAKPGVAIKLPDDCAVFSLFNALVLLGVVDRARAVAIQHMLSSDHGAAVGSFCLEELVELVVKKYGLQTTLVKPSKFHPCALRSPTDKAAFLAWFLEAGGGVYTLSACWSPMAASSTLWCLTWTVALSLIVALRFRMPCH